MLASCRGRRIARTPHVGSAERVTEEVPMAGRMSNRDRIAQKQAEAAAASKAKAAAKAGPEAAESPAKSPAKSPTRSTAKKAPPRMKIVWVVCESSGNHVMHYPYAQENEAIAEAKQRTEQTGKTHFVTRAEVPFE
jgi:hypothetical protein